MGKTGLIRHAFHILKEQNPIYDRFMGEWLKKYKGKLRYTNSNNNRGLKTNANDNKYVLVSS